MDSTTTFLGGSIILATIISFILTVNMIINDRGENPNNKYYIPTNITVLDSYNINTTVLKTVEGPRMVECEPGLFCDLWVLCIVPQLNKSNCWCVIRQNYSTLFQEGDDISVWFKHNSRECGLFPYYKETMVKKEVDFGTYVWFCVASFCAVFIYALGISVWLCGCAHGSLPV